MMITKAETWMIKERLKAEIDRVMNLDLSQLQTELGASMPKGHNLEPSTLEDIGRAVLLKHRVDRIIPNSLCY